MVSRALHLSLMIGAALVVAAVGPVHAQETDTAVQAPVTAAPAAASNQLGPPLVSLASAPATTDKIQVAGIVDHPSLVTDRQAGTFAFDLEAPGGTTLHVVAPGRPPYGFGRTSVVVVEGRWRDGALRAGSVLIPGTNRGLLGVMAITMIVWLGLFGYVFWLERRLSGLQRALSNHDEAVPARDPQGRKD